MLEPGCAGGRVSGCRKSILIIAAGGLTGCQRSDAGGLRSWSVLLSQCLIQLVGIKECACRIKMVIISKAEVITNLCIGGIELTEPSTHDSQSHALSRTYPREQCSHPRCHWAEYNPARPYNRSQEANQHLTTSMHTDRLRFQIIAAPELLRTAVGLTT